MVEQLLGAGLEGAYTVGAGGRSMGIRVPSRRDGEVGQDVGVLMGPRRQNSPWWSWRMAGAGWKVASTFFENSRS